MSDHTDLHAGRSGFPTTQWDVVGRGQESLGSIYETYKPALRAYLMRVRRIRREDADDLVHGFVSTQMLEKDLIGIADKTKGRFRSLLVTALDRYVNNEWRRLRAVRRRPKLGKPSSLDDRADSLPASRPRGNGFEIAWARQLIDETVNAMRDHYQHTNRPDIWGVFEDRLLRPALESAPPSSYRELCVRFGMKTPAKTACLLATGKRMFKSMLRAVVSRYVETEEEIDEEILDLIRILASGMHEDGEDGE